MRSASEAIAAIAYGALLRCPRCRQGRMYRGTEPRPGCAHCGASFEPSSGDFTGAMMFGIGFFGFVGLGTWFILSITVGVSFWLSIAWVLLFGGVIPGFLYRNFRGAWVGAMYAFGGLEPPGPNATYTDRPSP